LDGAGYSLVDRNQLNVDPVTAQALAVRESLRTLVEAQSVIVTALPGQSVVIRYPRLANMPEDKLQEAIEKEAGQHIPYDLSEVFLDWTLLDTVQQGDDKLLKILLLAAKHEQIDARLQVTQAADVSANILGVDALALADAAEVCDNLRVGETVALINIGLTSVSIHFVKDGISNFIRDISWGGRDLIQSISRARRCEYDEAEKLLLKANMDPSAVPAVPVSIEPPPPPTSSPPTSSLLDPFEDEPGGSGGPSLNASAKTSLPPISGKPIEEIMAAPLAKLVSEIRRSFDYYEHELYESPVNRLILSGGVASIPLLRSTLSDELSIKDVDVANPAESALQIGDRRGVLALTERPAQFMVAVGLAARGAATL
jgi:type IV pilus assembly protein PilM